ncbi:hypothetical protein MRB53_036904 [Persea americana]|nr:hypothetical protein MRB53_036904 [Persea americana]
MRPLSTARMTRLHLLRTVLPTRHQPRPPQYLPKRRARQSSLPQQAARQAKGGNKRRSSTGVPEHKAKNLKKKKSTADLKVNLDAKPGDYFWARLKGYPPWPCVICDEEMLPEALLQNRPVTAARPDGSYLRGLCRRWQECEGEDISDLVPAHQRVVSDW